MEGQDSPCQHNHFAQQLSALEKLLVLSYSQFSVDDLYQNLRLLIKDGAKDRGILKINSLVALQDCINLYMQSKKTPEDVERVNLFRDKFFRQVEHLRQIYEFFHNTVYTCLYEFYYDPVSDVSADEDIDELSEAEDATHDKISPISTPAVPQKPSEPSAESSVTGSEEKSTPSRQHHRSQKRKKSHKKKRKDNRLQVLERIKKEKADREAQMSQQKLHEVHKGMEFDELENASDRKRLSVAVRHVYAIQDKWKQLHSGKPILIGFFDPDSLHDIKQFKSYLPFEPMLRLIPDILVKGFKLVELSKVWYNSARSLYGPKQALHKSIEVYLNKIVTTDNLIMSMTDDTKSKKDLNLSHKSEWRFLVQKMLRHNEIRTKYDLCAKTEMNLKKQLKDLNGIQEDCYNQLQGLARDDPEYRVVYVKMQKLDQDIGELTKRLQVASYEFAIVNQDYQVEVEARPNLIRLVDDVKQIIKDIESRVEMNKQTKEQALTELTLLQKNCHRMWDALSGNCHDPALNELALKLFYHTQINETTQPVFIQETQPLGRESIEMASMEQQLQQNLEKSDTPLAVRSEALVTSQTDSDSRKQFNPSAAGLVDPREAAEYLKRVERLKRNFQLDLSQLKTEIDVSVEKLPEPTPSKSPIIVASPLSSPDVSSADEEVSDLDKKLVDSPLPNPVPTQEEDFGNEGEEKLTDEASDNLKIEDVFLTSYPQKPSTPVESTKTVYILKRSVPQPKPETVYILKRSFPAPSQRLLKSEETMADRVPKEQKHLDQLSNAVERNVRTQFIDTLSIYKETRLQARAKGDAMQKRPAFANPSNGSTQEDRQSQDIDINDDDISVDNGAGSSLSSESDTDNSNNEPSINNSEEYKHQTRVTATNSTQPDQRSRQAGHPFKPGLQRLDWHRTAFNRTSDLAEESSIIQPVQKRPIMASHESPADRSTLFADKLRYNPQNTLQRSLFEQVPQTKFGSKTPKSHTLTGTHRLAPLQKTEPQSSLDNKALHPAIQRVNKPPKRVGKRETTNRVTPVAKHFIDSSSDSDDEIFKRTSVGRHSQPAKPRTRVMVAGRLALTKLAGVR